MIHLSRNKELNIPSDSSELIVITKAKNLAEYVITITEKAPPKFRGVFVNRMQNLCLDAISDLLNANFIHSDSLENKTARAKFQTGAIIKMKMLGYIAMMSETGKCIREHQFQQISSQAASVISLTAAWRKSDQIRFAEKNSADKE
ncbi:MAG: four helix bundle protein [Rickettsiales bacterium]|jgi:hypothetical protein|nr:four helix bundle protein [Rickettsiales bacterium]